MVLHVALESRLAEPTERTFGDATDACFQRLFPTSPRVSAPQELPTTGDHCRP